MANTVTILSYANTFGDWIVTTNALAKENNDFAANNYSKPTGTLYLNDPTLGLQVANTAIIAGQLQVTGIGSSAYVQNNLRVDKQVYFTNTVLSLVASGQVNVGGIILAQASGTGIAVSNNATIGGTITVTGQSNLNGVTYVNNDLYVSGNTNISNTVQITGTTTVSNNVIITGNTSVSQFVYVTKDVLANNITAAYISLANTLVANIATISPSIYSNITYANTISANVIVNTPTLVVTGTEYVDTVRANTLITVPTATIATRIDANTAVGYLNSVQANTVNGKVSVLTPTLIVTGTEYVDTISANTVIYAPTANISTTISANTATGYFNKVQANTITLTTLVVTGTEYVDTVLANTVIAVPTANIATVINANTATGFFNRVQANNISTTGLTLNTLVVTGTEFVDTIKANTNISVPTANVSTRLDANSASGYFNTLQTNGQFTVGGNFVINGSTVYNSNNFTLNSGSTIGLSSEFDVNRGTSGANASIRWNESQTYWDIKDVSTGTYYQVLTTEQLNNTVTSTSTITAATANVANTLNNSINSSNVYLSGVISSTNTYLSGVITTANNYTANVLTYATSAYNKANAANVLAQAAFDKANTESGTFNGTTGQATPTSGGITFTSTNGVTIAGSSNTLTINTPQDLRTTGTPTFSSLTLSNALAINQGGTGASSASQALTNLLPTGTTSGYVLTTGGPGSFYWAAGGGGGSGATPGTTIQSSRLSYTGDGSNTAFTTPTYIPGDSQLRVYIDGVRQFPSAYTETSNAVVTLTTAPPLNSKILLEVDGYIVNPYYANNIAFTVNSNISSSANTIQLAIDGLTSKVVTNYALQTFAQASYNLANTANVLAQAAFNQANTATTQIIPITQGGTGATSATQALNNLLPTGETSGYVLTTGGSGNFYWAAAGSGGGATPGTTINTTRIYPTVNASQTVFTTPTYTPGTGQLRVYINGVRQFGSEYTETSNTVVTLGTGTTAGDVVLLEVDGYINNPYYANNIAYTVNSNISSTANTIQLALDGLTSKLVTYYANTSLTYANPTWITSLASTKITGSIPAANISGLATSATTDTSNASNITSGTLSVSRLGTSGDVQFNSIGAGTAASGVTGEIRAANNITAYYSSDISLKENVNDITNAVDIVYQIGGKTFDWTDDYIKQHGGEDDYFLRKSDFGVIAQDVEKVFPLAIRTRPDGLLAVDYEKLCALAFAAIKELKDEIEILKGNSK